MSPAKRHKPYSTAGFVKALSERGARVSLSTVIRACIDGEIELAEPTPGGHRRIKAKALARYLREHPEKIVDKT